MITFIGIVALIISLFIHFNKSWFKEKELPFKKGQPPQHITNGKKLEEHLLFHYYKVLDIPHEKRLSEELIKDGYERSRRYLDESIKLNEKPRYSQEEIEAARIYLQDFINYMAYVN